MVHVPDYRKDKITKITDNLAWAVDHEVVPNKKCVAD
jgi:hypothetical protein